MKNRMLYGLMLLVILAAGCVPVGTPEAPTALPVIPTETKRPSYVPLPIVQQTITNPIDIPLDFGLYNTIFGDSGVVEYVYQRECRIKHPEPEWACVYGGVLGFGIMIYHFDPVNGDVVVIFENKMAYDYRTNIVGIPSFNPEDRVIWSTQSDIWEFVTDHNLQSNKGAIIVRAQVYEVAPYVAEWELLAFGGPLTSQRFISTDGKIFFPS